MGGGGRFQKKQTTLQNVQHLYSYTIIQGKEPDLNILFLFTGDWTQVYQSVFGSTEKKDQNGFD